MFGPEMETARVVAAAWGRRIMLIKHALSGAHLANDDLADSFYPLTGTQWTTQLNRTIAAFAYERGQGRECEIYSFFWFQNEADMIGVTGGGALYVSSYQSNLNLYTDTYRDLISLRGFGRSNLRFIAIKSAIAIVPYTTVVNGSPLNVQANNAIQAACDANENAQAMWIADIATFIDGIHLDAPAQVKVGNRRALIALSSFAPFIAWAAKVRNYILTSTP